MITSSPSPSLHSRSHSSPLSPRPNSRHYNGSNGPSLARPQASPVSGRAPSLCPEASSKTTTSFSTPSPTVTDQGSVAAAAAAATVAVAERSHHYIDAATQWSPPHPKPRFSTSHQSRPDNALAMRGETPIPQTAPKSPSLSAQSPTAVKRSNASSSRPPSPSQSSSHPPTSLPTTSSSLTSEGGSSPKRSRPAAPPLRIMPLRYETCNIKDLVVLISSMLMELIRFNDTIPLRDGHLTRFHSRAPPGISVHDYLQRLATHATLSPPILLSMVYYIDRLCSLYPAFTISSLTIHRFLITSATVASKGLSDSFWTNKTYARVGGVSIRELALLELEFLWRVEWKIVPQPEVLVDYYMSLVQRSDGYELESL